jgi:hypothetical protein
LGGAQAGRLSATTAHGKRMTKGSSRAGPPVPTPIDI